MLRPYERPMKDTNPVESVRSQSMGWRFQRIARKLDDAMNARLAPHDLNIQQFAVLMSVIEKDGQTQSDIGAQFGMPAYAISRALDHLEQTGRVERRPHPTSRRALTIHASEPGKALFPSLVAIINEVNAELLAPLSEVERKTLGDLLFRLIT